MDPHACIAGYDTFDLISPLSYLLLSTSISLVGTICKLFSVQILDFTNFVELMLTGLQVLGTWN